MIDFNCEYVQWPDGNVKKYKVTFYSKYAYKKWCKAVEQKGGRVMSTEDADDYKLIKSLNENSQEPFY